MGLFALKTLEFDKIKELVARKAATTLGKERLLSLQVTREFSTAKKYLTETDEALRLLSEGKRFPLGGATDITELVKRAQIGSALEPEELLAVGNVLIAMRQMKEFLKPEVELAPALAEYGNILGVFAKLEKQLENAISEKGEMKDSASTKLGGLRTGIVIAKNRVKEKLDSILHSTENQKYFQEQLITMRGDRYVIPIKQEYRFNFPGVVHDESGSGATLFIEPMAVVNLNNDIKKYLAQEKEEIERILRQLSGFVGMEAETILASLEIFTNLDVICAKALLAIDQKAVRPMLLVDGYVEISKGRHPLLAADKVVPIDINVGNTFNTLLITGPNTGGKTVALKTVGLFALMAQSGLFVPARFAKLPVFNAVYADIGDEQSIEQSLSTFSGHLRNIVEILNEVKAKDLVLIDEICAGTDPNEGAALAMSIITHLHNRKVVTIITTHYSELKTFAFEQQEMENASVEFDPATLSPTYRLLMGVPGSSNAFYISERLGLSKEIIDNAGTMLKQEHSHMENVLQNLDVERRQYEQQNKETETLKIEASKLKQELQREKTALEKRKNEMLKKAREEADEIYRGAKQEALGILKDLRGLKDDFETERYDRLAKEAKEKLTKSFDFESIAGPEGKLLDKAAAKVGKQVYLPFLAQKGVIIEVLGDQVVVQIGMMKTTVSIDKCVALNSSKITAQPEKTKLRKNYAHKMFVVKSEVVGSEIDVRGKTVEEAIVIIDKFIDDAVLAGVGKIRIIHGKGTGMLRSGLNSYFAGNKSIKNSFMAAPEEGGSGATILEL